MLLAQLEEAEATGSKNSAQRPAAVDASAFTDSSSLPLTQPPNIDATHVSTPQRPQSPLARHAQSTSYQPAQYVAMEHTSCIQSLPMLSLSGEREHRQRHDPPSPAFPSADPCHDELELPTYATFFMSDTLGGLDMCLPRMPSSIPATGAGTGEQTITMAKAFESLPYTFTSGPPNENGFEAGEEYQDWLQAICDSGHESEDGCGYTDKQPGNHTVEHASQSYSGRCGKHTGEHIISPPARIVECGSQSPLPELADDESDVGF